MLKPANANPKTTQKGSSSADLDRGVVNDNDDDDADEGAYSGISTSVPDAGAFELFIWNFLP
jgi:methionyl aminopeptidase